MDDVGDQVKQEPTVNEDEDMWLYGEDAAVGGEGDQLTTTGVKTEQSGEVYDRLPPSNNYDQLPSDNLTFDGEGDQAPTGEDEAQADAEQLDNNEGEHDEEGVEDEEEDDDDDDIQVTIGDIRDTTTTPGYPYGATGAGPLNISIAGRRGLTATAGTTGAGAAAGSKGTKAGTLDLDA